MPPALASVVCLLVIPRPERERALKSQRKEDVGRIRELEQLVKDREEEVNKEKERSVQHRQDGEGHVKTIREDKRKLEEEHAFNYQQKQKLQRDNDELTRENQNLKSEVSRLIILQADSNTRHVAMKASNVVNETIKNWTSEHAILRKQHHKVLTMLGDYEKVMQLLAKKLQEGGWEDESFRDGIQSMMGQFCGLESIHDAIEDDDKEFNKNRPVPSAVNMHGI